MSSPSKSSKSKTPKSKHDIVVVGGAGHVGAPLSIVLAKKGFRTLIYDISKSATDTLSKGKLPFLEEGGEPLLQEVLAAGMLGFSNNAADIRGIPYVVLTIGTPVDEFHNPVLRVLTECMDALLPHLSDEQTIILRSTVFPGATDFLADYLKDCGKKCLVAFCPERVVQGRAIKEIQSLVQMVSGTTPAAEESAVRLFSKVAQKTVRMKPMEAEFAKLFCNTYRYMQFATANQFYMLADAAGLSYARIRERLMEDYPRMRDLPGAGFAAGPCLYKDTLQLVAFAENKLALALSAIQVNEGMPAYIVSCLKEKYPLKKMTVGLLGMAFKADSDDGRSSLSYKLKKLLTLHAKEVLTTDPFVTTDKALLPLNEVVRRSDVLILCTPHSAYAKADLRGKPVYDMWNFFKA
ncbi:MAG: nucleotide sugar dehydrogenase [Verrucomicrobia bacterium]|nr:MAG: nucleotide sugar dehydrogenase [Verrucomicrobiota bacterium]